VGTRFTVSRLAERWTRYMTGPLHSSLDKLVDIMNAALNIYLK
jgi:hypothetical protein